MKTRRKTQLKSGAFTLAVAFSLYLMVSLRVSSAQSVYSKGQEHL